jgi:hypothetical protein
LIGANHFSESFEQWILTALLVYQAIRHASLTIVLIATALNSPLLSDAFALDSNSCVRLRNLYAEEPPVVTSCLSTISEPETQKVRVNAWRLRCALEYVDANTKLLV